MRRELKRVDLDLRTLRPNPYRDFQVDPLEDDVETLVDSINEHGLWPGVVIGEYGGHHVVLAGHKRIHAAIKAGITHRIFEVGQYPPAQMIKIYADENLTHRGEKSGLAVAGAIISAARYLIKGILQDDDHIPQICGMSHKALESVRGNITSQKGLGAEVIIAFYKGREGMKESVVAHHIANLKASGDYARIVKEVGDEIAQEQAVELAELERKEKAAEAAQKAEEAAKAKAKTAKVKAKHARTKETSQKAAEASAKKKPTFDLTGVGKFLKTEHQIRTFRKVMEREAVQAHLPFDKQAEYAARLVDYANKHDIELTAQLIDDYTTALIRDVGAEQGRINKDEMRKIEAENERVRWTNLSHHFCRQLGGVFRDGKEMTDMMSKNPTLRSQSTRELQEAVKWAKPMINKIADGLGIL